VLSEHFLCGTDTGHRSFVFHVIEVTHADGVETVNGIILLALVDDAVLGVKIGVDKYWMSSGGIIRDERVIRKIIDWIAVEDVEEAGR
jgi:hypothetical protein